MKSFPYSKLEHFRSMPLDHPVRIYSYQEPEALERIKSVGYLTGPSESDVDDHFKDSYDWMREQMAERVQDYSGEYPVWGWLKRPSAKLKHQRCHYGVARIRITAIVPKARILLSDYETWHSVLNNGAFTNTDEEDNAFDHDDMEKIKSTWVRIFDFEKRTDPKIISWLGSSKNYVPQACIDRIYADEIISTKLWGQNRQARGG